MRFLISFLLPILLLVNNISCGYPDYPKVKRNDSVIDNYFGTQIADPYRWLEEISSNETKQFTYEQSYLTHNYLSQFCCLRESREVLTKLWDYPKERLPKVVGTNYFIFKNSGLQNQWVLHRSKSLEDLYTNKTDVYINPNELSSDGSASISDLWFSINEEILAYAIDRSGSDRIELHLKNISTGENFPEVLNHTKFTDIAWTHDNLGFFYMPYHDADVTDKSNLSTKGDKIFYHRVGTTQEQDVLAIQLPNTPEEFDDMKTTDDGKYLLVKTSHAAKQYYVFYAKIGNDSESGIGFQSELEIVPLVAKPAYYSFIGNQGPIFYFVTDEDAPNRRLIAMDINNPDKKHWANLVCDNKEDVMDWAKPIAKKFLLVSYTRNAKSTLELRNLANGTLVHEYELPPATLQTTEGKRKDNKFFFSLATFTEPDVTYSLTFGDNGEVPKKPELVHRTAFNGINSGLYETRQAFYESKDGTKVPMFLVHRKDFNRTGDAPTLLYANGGFQSNTSPYFSNNFLAFVSMTKGLLAIPGIRGGGVHGKEWWEAGRLLNKQNSFDDFISAAEYLIKENYTNPFQLTVQGASDGGLVVAASINQRPDLFGAAVVEAGTLDMLRFQKFPEGSSLSSEYGTSDNETHFQNLIKYSPLHNIKNDTKDQYPAVLVLTADKDNRVSPAHSYKYIAQLQNTVKRQVPPFLLLVDFDSSSDKPAMKQIAELSDIFIFMNAALNYVFYQPE